MSTAIKGQRLRGLLCGAPTVLALLSAGLHADEAKRPSGEPGAAPGEEAASADAASSFRLEITASAWFASLDGWLQTSKGGNAGTTSQHRPKVDEVGLDGLDVLPLVDARFTLFASHQLHLSYASISMDGQDTLHSTLISQGETFPAGSPVTSSVDLDMLRLGYRALWLQPKLGAWTMTPEIGFAWDPFHYKLQSPSATGPVDRSYAISYPYLGLLFEGPVYGSLKAEVELAGSAGINGVTFADGELRLLYPVVSLRHMQVDVAAGLKGTWLRREDNQSPQHNDVNLRIGAFSGDPWGGFTMGLRVSF